MGDIERDRERAIEREDADLCQQIAEVLPLNIFEYEVVVPGGSTWRS